MEHIYSISSILYNQANDLDLANSDDLNDFMNEYGQILIKQEKALTEQEKIILATENTVAKRN